MYAACRALLRSSVLALAGVCATLTATASGLDEEADFRAARLALDDGLPSVAAVKATRLLEAARWDSTERLTLASLAVEAWVRAKNGAEALKILEKERVPNSIFWQAQALVLAGDTQRAEELLVARLRAGEATSQERLLLAHTALSQWDTTLAREVLATLRHNADARTARTAGLMLDEMDMTTGNHSSAVKNLSSPANLADPVARSLRARGLVETGLHDQAQTELRAMLAATYGGEHAHHAAAVLLADSLLRQEKPNEAAEVLVLFLDNTAESTLWTEAFDLLARVFESSRATVLPADAVLRWITDGSTAQRQTQNPAASTGTFSAHAMLLLSRWLLARGRTLESLGLLEAMIQTHPGHPQAAEAMHLALETYGALKADDRVTALADQWRQRFGASRSAMVDFVTGGTAFSRGEFRQAAQLFQTAADVATTLAERRAALYNAGVAAVRAGELLLYQTLLGQLQIVSAGADTSVRSGDAAADLELDRALDMAARAQPEALAELRTFIQQRPSHPRLPEAHLALAETTLAAATSPDFTAVEGTLQAVAALPALSPTLHQRIALNRIWLLDRKGDLKGVTEAGAAFLKQWPAAAQSATVRMRVADAFFRQESYAAARTEFELVAKDYPTSPHADTALYFAGIAALSMLSDEGRETAINLWQELAERGGPLSIPARQQQALAKRRAGEEAEALRVLDSLLTEKGLSEDMQHSLVCEKAEILMLLGKTDAARLTEAVNLLHEMRREDDLSYLWRARAGYTLAAALNAAGSVTEALEACYDVVQSTGFTGPSNPAEFRWYYRAGFFAIELLETAKQWEAAARIAEKLAQSSGDRAAEAKERATKIRLEHFLWEGETR